MGKVSQEGRVGEGKATPVTSANTMVTTHHTEYGGREGNGKGRGTGRSHQDSGGAGFVRML